MLVLRELFIHLCKTRRNILLSFKVLEKISLPNGFVLSNVEITSSTSLGITGGNVKGLIIMYLPLIFFILWCFLYLLTIFLIGSGLFHDSDKSGYLNNPRDDVMDWKWILNSRRTSIFLKIRPSLSESIIFPEVFIPLFKK